MDASYCLCVLLFGKQIHEPISLQGDTFLWFYPVFLSSCSVMLSRCASRGFFTGCNDRLETKWFPPTGSGMGFPYRKLANGESQKGEPDVALIVVEGMGKAGFAWLQFQPNAL